MPGRVRQGGGGLWVALLIILVVSGLFLALHFWRSPESLQQMLDAARSLGESPSTTNPPAASPVEVPAPARDRILTCTAADGSSFYTNAARCEDADLDNRLTEVPAHQPAAEPRYGQNCLDPKQPHHFLPVCAEPFRAALELEQELAKSEAPVDSPQATEYCELIAQGVQAGCPATSALFCYLRVCQELLEKRAAEGS